MQNDLLHSLYQIALKEQQVEAISWVFKKDQSSPQLYYHKLPKLKQHQVTIKIHYTSLCQSDLMTVRLKWGDVKQYPFCPGHEVVGQISDKGSQVKLLNIGDKVGVTPLRFSCNCCNICQQNLDQYCPKRQFVYGNDFSYFGGYSTHIQCSEKHAILLPQDIEIQTAAPLLCAGLTVYSPLNQFKKTGFKCGVIGIGGLGHLAIQFANRMNMQVTAFTTSQERKQQFRKMGASHINHSTNIQSLQKQYGKYDLICNTLYIQIQQVYKAHIRLLKPGGTLILLSAPNKDVKLNLDMQYIIQNGIQIAGSIIGSAKDTKQMFQFCTNFGIKPIVQTLSFQRLPQAFEKLQKGKPKYRMNINVIEYTKQKKL